MIHNSITCNCVVYSKEILRLLMQFLPQHILLTLAFSQILFNFESMIFEVVHNLLWLILLKVIIIVGIDLECFSLLLTNSVTDKL